MRIAVLMTIFKRQKETLKCLDALMSNNLDLDIYISDSNSKNNIESELKKYNNINFQNVGDDIFWNQGMNFSWIKAFDNFDYDFYIWLNNDTFLFKNALEILFNDYNKIETKSILVGITEYNNELTYGGRKKFGGELMKPNGFPQQVRIMNGNCVLIPKSSFKKLGFLDKKFSHSLGDIDYGLRAIKNSIPIYCTSELIGLCKKNNYVWYGSKSFYERFKNLKSPKGVPINEYFYFNKKHFGFTRGIKFLLATFLALFFPKIFKIVSNK